MANKCKCNLYSYRHMRWVFFFKYFCKLEKGTWDRKYKYILISSSIDLFEVIIFLGQWSSLISLACFSVASHYWLLNVGPMTRYKFCNVTRKIAKILYFFVWFQLKSTHVTLAQTKLLYKHEVHFTMYSLKIPMLQHSAINLFNYQLYITKMIFFLLMHTNNPFGF